MLRAAAPWHRGLCPGTPGYLEIPGDDGRSCPRAMDVILVMFSIAGPRSHFHDNPSLVPMSTGAVITRVSLASPGLCPHPESHPHFQLHTGCY